MLDRLQHRPHVQVADDGLRAHARSDLGGSVGGTYTLEKNIEKEFSSHETRAMSPRGGLTMGRTAEGRSELAKLADDSASSADAAPSHPPHEEQGE